MVKSLVYVESDEVMPSSPVRKYIRECPVCGIYIEYTTEKVRDRSDLEGKKCIRCRNLTNTGFAPYMKGENITGERNPFYGKKHSDDTRKKMRECDRSYRQEEWYRELMSIAMSGENNPMYGRSVYSIWVEKYGEQIADEKFTALRKIRSIQATGTGNSMYGKPSPSGSGGGWSGWYNGVYFRSLRELTMMVRLDDAGTKWRSAEYIKIEYVSENGHDRTYSPDFIVEDVAIVEVKPEQLMEITEVVLKAEAAKYCCSINCLTYQLIDPGVLDEDLLDAMHDSGLVKFIDRYEQRYADVRSRR